MKKLFNLSFFYLILGLALGIFFREFTKFNAFTGITTLSAAHTHTLVLGFILSIIVYLLISVMSWYDKKSNRKWLIITLNLILAVITVLSWIIKIK